MEGLQRSCKGTTLPCAVLDLDGATAAVFVHCSPLPFPLREHPPLGKENASCDSKWHAGFGEEARCMHGGRAVPCEPQHRAPFTAGQAPG